MLPVLLGDALLQLISGRKQYLPRKVEVALSFGLGMGLISQYMLALGALKIQYTTATLILPALLMSGILFLTKKMTRQSHYQDDLETSGHSLIEFLSDAGFIRSAVLIAAFCLIAFILLYSFYRALSLPVYSWDAIATMVFKGKIIYYEKTLEYLRNFPHPTYPLQVSLFISWISIISGVWSDVSFKVIFPMTLFSFVIFMYYFLRKYSSQLRSLLGVLMLLSSNLLIMHSTIAYRDLVQMYYVCTALMLIILWVSENNDFFLVLSSLFSGFSTFIKLEGTAYLILLTFIFAFALVQKKGLTKKDVINKSLKYIIPSYGIMLFYSFYKILISVPQGEKVQVNFTLNNLMRIPSILFSFWNDLFFSGNWNILWMILVISILCNWRKILRYEPVRLLSTALLAFFGLYFLNALLTTNYIWISGAKHGSTLPRLILHFFPVCPMLITLLNVPETKSAAENNVLQEDTENEENLKLENDLPESSQGDPQEM